MATGDRAPYGRQPASPPIPTYYGLPAVKQSHYRWLIATYFFVGGLAGAAQVIAAIADLLGARSRGNRAIARAARYLALVGATISPVLLIADLHTPSRWYNMLRIFRPTSPMSFGAWTLGAFGTLSGLTALGQLLADATRGRVGAGLASAFGLPAAAAGVVMSFYTGILLSATSTPLWMAAYRRLPALFAATATATATAALSLLLQWLGAPSGALRRLGRLALVASAAQFALSRLTEQDWKRLGVAAAIERQPTASFYKGGAIGLGIAVPLVIHTLQVLTERHSRFLSTLAAVLTLAGGYAERAVIVLAGNQSGLSPEDYFRLTQPSATPAPLAPSPALLPETGR